MRKFAFFIFLRFAEAYFSKFCINILNNGKETERCKAEHCENVSTERPRGLFKKLCLGDAFVYDFVKCSAVLSLFDRFLLVSFKFW